MTRLTDLKFKRLEKLSTYCDRFKSLKNDLQNDSEIFATISIAGLRAKT